MESKERQAVSHQRNMSSMVLGPRGGPSSDPKEDNDDKGFRQLCGKDMAAAILPKLSWLETNTCSSNLIQRVKRMNSGSATAAVLAYLCCRTATYNKARNSKRSCKKLPFTGELGALADLSDLKT